MSAPGAPPPAIPLARARAGVAMVVTAQVAAPAAVRRRLAELGVRVGSHVSVRQRTSGGGAILAIGDARLAVSGDILAAVLVRPDEAVTA